MKPELVEKVAAKMHSMIAAATVGEPVTHMARYALALAERAAREAVRLTGRADYSGARIYSTAEILETAVERAVEGE